MSCPNPNCTSGCNCNNCCPPVPPPTPPTPPICEGTECVELYDGGCVQYTGPAITCFGITPNMTFNTIVSMIANTLCDCTQADKCINPMVLFFERFKFIYDTISLYDEDIDFADLFKAYVENGLIVKKCQYCCSDNLAYGLFFNGEDADIFETNISNLNDHEITTPCVSCWENYDSCATEFLTLFETTLNGDLAEPLVLENIYEFGGFSNQSGICVLVNIFKDLFTYEQITGIVEIMMQDNFLVVCDIASGNIVIGNYNQVGKYIEANIKK
jgi:hypothetical protein